MRSASMVHAVPSSQATSTVLLPPSTAVQTNTRPTPEKLADFRFRAPKAKPSRLTFAIVSAPICQSSLLLKPKHTTRSPGKNCVAITVGSSAAPVWVSELCRRKSLGPRLTTGSDPTAWLLPGNFGVKISDREVTARRALKLSGAGTSGALRINSQKKDCLRLMRSAMDEIAIACSADLALTSSACVGGCTTSNEPEATTKHSLPMPPNSAAASPSAISLISALATTWSKASILARPTARRFTFFLIAFMMKACSACVLRSVMVCSFFEFARRAGRFLKCRCCLKPLCSKTGRDMESVTKGAGPLQLIVAMFGRSSVKEWPPK
mmetsp:Transcript_124631/g.399149  ORF Transcript_124631/g.399149 Transcript_124631/m.399149 type:complete len:323 (-) Transcript_124631:1661-2629(-)